MTFGGAPAGAAETRSSALPRRVRELAPYLLVLAGAAFLYYKASRFSFDPQADRIGPDNWPKLLLLCLAAVCIFEIVRRLVLAGRGPAVTPPATTVATEESFSESDVQEEAHPLAVVAVVLVTVAYLVAWETAGFFIATFIYTWALMWIGNFRSLVWGPALSFAFSFGFMFLFMRVIFVDLPLGTEPFLRVSTALLRIMGIH